MKNTFENWYELRGREDIVSPERSKELREKGFFAQAELYADFKKYGYDDYANDRGFCNIHPINGWFSKLIDDKRFIPIIFRSAPQYVPELSIGIEKQKISYILESGNYISVDTNDDIKNVVVKYLTRYNSLFVKPAGSSSGGRGTFKIDNTTGMEILENIQKNHAYIINNCLENEEYAKNINPYGVNTMRVNFYKNKNHELNIINIVHCFGSKESKGVDNIRSGGMACEINLITGELSKAWIPTMTPLWREFYGESKQKIEGFIIPNWKDKLRQIYEILGNLMFLEFGGLDIVPTPTGLILIEINSLPSRQLLQLTKPAFLNPGFKEFCISKGYKV